MAPPALLDLWVLRVRRASLAPQAAAALAQVRKAHQASPGPRALSGLLDRPVSAAPPAPPALREPLDHRDRLALLVPLALRAFRARPALQAVALAQVLLVPKVRPAPRVSKDLQVSPALSARKARPALSVPRAFKDHPVLLARRDPPDRPEL